MNRFKPHEWTYLRKLMLLCILLCTVPLLVVGGFSSIQSTRYFLAQAEELNSYALSQTQISVEQALKNVEAFASGLANSPAALTAVQMPREALHYRAVSAVAEMKSTRDATDLPLEDIFLISTQGGWILSDRGIQSCAEVLPARYAYLYEGSLPFDATWFYAPQNEIYPSVLPYLNVDTINLAIRIPRYTSVPEGVAVANVRVSEIEKMIAKQSRLSGIAVMDAAGQAILGRGVIPEEDSWAEIRAALEQSAAHSGAFDAAGKKYHVRYVRSDYNGWYYLSILDVAGYTAGSRRIAWWTLCIGGVTGGVMIALAVLFSRRLYQPVLNLRRFVAQNFETRGERVPSPPNESADDFSLIRLDLKKHLDVTRLKEQIFSEQSLALRELYLHKLLDGRLSREKTIQHLQTLGCPADWHWFCVLALRIDSLDGSIFQDEENDIALYAAHNIVCELIGPQNLLGAVYQDSFLMIPCGAALTLEQTAKELFGSLAEKIVQSIAGILKVRLTVGMSRLCGDPGLLPAAGNEARDALNYSMLTDAASIIDIGEISGASFRLVLPQQILGAFFNAMRSNDRAEAYRQLDQMIHAILEEPINLQACKLSVLRFVISILDYMQKLDGDAPLPGATALYARLFEAGTFDEMRQLLDEQLVSPLFDVIDKRMESQERRISERIFALLGQDASCSLSLEECADRLHYSPSYISRVFKKETGSSYKEYQMLYRFERAKLLLSSTSTRIFDIAQALGYHNTQNFIRYFKNREGVTPNQYRAAHRTGSSGREAEGVRENRRDAPD